MLVRLFLSVFLFNPSLTLKNFTYCSQSEFKCLVLSQNEQPLFPFIALIFRFLLSRRYVYCAVGIES